MAIVVRCPTCRAIACAKVIQRDVWPAEMERMPVEQVRQAAWCRCEDAK